MHAVHIKTHGLRCQDCTALVEQSLSHIRGIKGVVSVQSMGLTSVLFDEKVIDSDRIAESIRSMGFEVERPPVC
jgi:copper chaperone CopZ